MTTAAQFRGRPGPGPRVRGRVPRKAALTWLALALLTVGSVGDLGSAPAMAVFGLASVVLYVVPAVVFLVPAALVSAELASGWKGGVYNWVSEGISPAMGFAAVWCQFAQTTFYYPAVLAYVASTLSYVFAPGLAHSGVYTTAVIIVLFWASVLVAARGVVAADKLASWGILIGTLIPGLLLVVLAAIYLLQGIHSAAPLNAHHVLPPWHGLTSIVLIVNGFFTYAGVEVNAVHVDDLRNPAREFPRAILLAVILILLVFIPPTLAISIAVPSQHISLTAGVMQAFRTLLDHFSLEFLEPVIAIGLVVASISGLLDWLTGPSTGLVQIGRERGYLPPYFQQVNANGVQLRILVAQGVVITADRAAVRAGPERVPRVLGVRGAGDGGLPDHVRADVRRGAQSATAPAQPPARLPRARAGDDLRGRRARVGRRVRRRPRCRRANSGTRASPCTRRRCWPECSWSACSRPSCSTGCAGPSGRPARPPPVPE